MKSVFQTITIIFSVTLILLGVCAFTMMPISSELLMKAMAIVGFIAAVLIIIAVIAVIFVMWYIFTSNKLNRLVVKIDEQYVISVCGRELLVDQFKQKLEAVYQEMVMVMIEERVS